MGILNTTIYSSSVNKNPGDRNFDNYVGVLDWCHFGRSDVADFESKSTGTIFSDYQDIGSPSVARVVGAAADSPQFKWTGGSPTATESSGAFGCVRNTTNAAGFRLDTSALDPSKIYRFVFFVSVNNGGADIDISLSEGAASAFSGSILSGTVESFEVQVVAQVDSATEYLRFDLTKTSGTQVRLQGAVVEDFGFELSLYDTFTDTNGTGIEDHTPDYVRAAGEVYEAVGATTTSTDPVGSGGITIQGNQLQFTVSSERARIYTGSKDNVIEAFLAATATSGHRYGLSPRHVDKANQYWFNLREPNDDYSFYTEDEDDAPSNQTNLLAGAQPYTFDTSKTYYVRCFVIDLDMRLEVDGELVNTFTDGADAIPGADGISFGVAGIGTNNYYDSIKVWSPVIPGAIASNGTLSVSGAAQLSGAGNLGSSGAQAMSGGAALGATGGIASAGGAQLAGVPTLQGDGQLASSGSGTAAGNANLQGQGVLGSVGAQSLQGVASISGAGSLQTTSPMTLAGVAGLGAEGLLSSSGAFGLTPAANLSGEGVLGSTGILELTGNMNLVGLGASDLVASSALVLTGIANLSGFGAVQSTATLALTTTATVEGLGALTSATTLLGAGVANLDGVAELNSNGVQLLSTNAALSGVGQLTSVGNISLLCAASLSGVGEVVTSGVSNITGIAPLEGMGNLSSQGDHSLTAQLALLADGYLATAGTISLIGLANTSIYGILRSSGIATITGIATLTDANAGLFVGVDNPTIQSATVSRTVVSSHSPTT